jgi:3-oxoacyl-[acyl-carrier-protein] synthase-3
LESVTASDPTGPLDPLAPRGAAVAALGVGLPERRLDNAPIAARLLVDERWILARTGIRERRIAADRETVADLATLAAGRALAAAGLDPAALGLVALATMSHERLIPNGASLVAERIGATAAAAVDVNAACSGFVSAFALAAGQIESGRVDSALVIGAEVLTRLTDHYDRRTAALFGDGAGAAVLAATDGPSRIGPVASGSDGARSELITAEREEGVIRMNGHDTFRQAVDRLCESTLEACALAGVELAEIDVFAYHQANARILTAVAERLELDQDRVVNCIDRLGNTSAATVPLALAHAEEAGLLRPGSRVLLAAFGGGLTWAATVVEWGRGGDA